MLYRDYLKSKYQNTAVKLANAEGVPCVLEYSKGKNMRNYEVYGNSVQDGTPSPESPVEIQSVGDLTTKNLLPNDWESGFISVSSGANQNSLTYVRTKDYFTFDISKNYYISSDSIDTSTTISWYFYDENKNFISRFVSYKNRTIGASGCQVTIPTNTVFFRLAVLTTDINIKVQIEAGSTATEYEPYHKYDIPITVAGKNLIPYPYFYKTTTINGVTFTDNGDGSITIDGTATANAVFYLVVQQDNYTLDKCGLKIGDSYTISKTLISGDSIANVYFTANYYNENGKMQEGAVISNRNTATKTIKSDFKSWGIYLLVLKDKTVNNTTIKPQLEKGSSATEYEPYKGRITEHIYLDEPLRKVDDYSDYIDFKGQRVVRKVGVSDNTGTKPISESLGALAIPTEEPIALPALKTFKGTSIMSVDTAVLPSNIKAKYIRT